MVTLSWFLPSTVWQCLVDFKLENVELGIVKELPENRLASCSVSIIVHKHPLFCWPRSLCPMVYLECVHLLHAEIRCIGKPARRKYADRLLDALAVLMVAEPNVLSSGVQLQVVYGWSELFVDDVEVFPGRPVVPQVHECQVAARPILKQHSVKLFGPNGGLRDGGDDGHTRKRAREQQSLDPCSGCEN